MPIRYIPSLMIASLRGQKLAICQIGQMIRDRDLVFVYFQQGRPRHGV